MGILLCNSMMLRVLPGSIFDAPNYCATVDDPATRSCLDGWVAVKTREEAIAWIEKAAEPACSMKDTGRNMRLICYTLDGKPIDIEPASNERDWIDDTRRQFAKRCLPLVTANSHGWQILCQDGCWVQMERRYLS
jgi:hypothetical protein